MLRLQGESGKNTVIFLRTLLPESRRQTQNTTIHNMANEGTESGTGTTVALSRVVVQHLANFFSLLCWLSNAGVNA